MAVARRQLSWRESVASGTPLLPAPVTPTPAPLPSTLYPLPPLSSGLSRGGRVPWWTRVGVGMEGSCGRIEGPGLCFPGPLPPPPSIWFSVGACRVFSLGEDGQPPLSTCTKLARPRLGPRTPPPPTAISCAPGNLRAAGGGHDEARCRMHARTPETFGFCLVRHRRGGVRADPFPRPGDAGAFDRYSRVTGHRLRGVPEVGGPGKGRSASLREPELLRGGLAAGGRSCGVSGAGDWGGRVCGKGSAREAFCLGGYVAWRARNFRNDVGAGFVSPGTWRCC